VPRPLPYAEASAWMHELALARLRGEVPDTVLLLEHPPVYTAGRMWKPEHVLWTEAAMRTAGAEFHLADRGGSVTFHGPGQLVGYAIVDLGPGGDVVAHLRRLEDVVIGACEDLGLRAARDPSGTGVWVAGRKACAIGVRVQRRRVTLHGFALNCSTDLSWFDAIVPCGIVDRGVTSLTKVMGRTVRLDEVTPLVITRFEEVFGVHLEVEASAARRGPEPASGGTRR
jgi:lipoyl(octanoyl) transferase